MSSQAGGAQRPLGARLWLVLLAALTALATLVIPAAVASASCRPAGETRVRVLTLAAPEVVGVHECTTAGQQWIRGPSQLRAEDAARFGSINYGHDQSPFHIGEARVPSSFVGGLYRGHANRMPFLRVNPDQLAGLNQLSDVRTWDPVRWMA